MQLPKVEATCDVCGGSGFGSHQAAWFGGVHTDPNVCRRILDSRKTKLDEQEKRISDQSADAE